MEKGKKMAKTIKELDKKINETIDYSYIVLVGALFCATIIDYIEGITKTIVLFGLFGFLAILMLKQNKEYKK